ncbi:MAG: hypothetical protein MJ234_00345 [bacterium]|nr:hypothetical protein [bacterium]
MAGIGNVGSFGMPDFQFKSAMVSTSGFAAQGTGTAKQYSSNIEEQLQPKQDGVTFSENALTLSDDAQELQQNQKADQAEQQKELKKNDQDQNKIGKEYSQGTEEFQPDESFEKKLQQMRMKHNAGHAAMATGAKPKESEKAENKSDSHINSKNLFKGTSKAEESEGANHGYDLKEMMEDLNQAAHLGLLESEARKYQSKESNVNIGGFGGGLNNSNAISGDYSGKVNAQKSAEEIKAEKMIAEDIERIINRTPEEILADVPVHFKSTAQIMVMGQVDAVGAPKASLTELKSEPRAESAMLELMPAENFGEIEVAELSNDSMAMQLEFPEEVPA